MWADLTVIGSNEYFCNFAKVSYFWGRVFHVFMDKISIMSALKMLTYIKVRNRPILALKYTCWGVKMDKSKQKNNLCEKENFPCFMYLIQIFGIRVMSQESGHWTVNLIKFLAAQTTEALNCGASKRVIKIKAKKHPVTFTIYVHVCR